VIFTNNVRLHVPSTSERLDPYFVAGGGIANVRQSADFIYGPFVFPAGTVPPGVSISPVLPVPPITTPYTTASTALVLTLGGGIGVRVASHLWIDGDLRLFRLMDSDDRNLGRFGVGVRYRF
jgi:opacity protein-like surface antigen